MYKAKSLFLKKSYKILNDILIDRKNTQPNEIAYRFLINDKESETITYKELYQRVCQLSTYIQKVSKPLDRIILAAKPGFDFIIGFFSCLMTRTIAVPIFPPANDVMANRFLHVLKNAQPSLILCDKETTTTLHHAQKANLFIPGKIKKMFGISKTQSQVLSMIRKLRLEIFSIGDSKDFLTSEQFLPPCSPEDIAFLQYTSGSTTNPRGVMLSHANLLDNLQIIHNACHYSPEAHLFSWLPPYHDMGLIAGILSPFFEGMSATLMSTLDFIIRPSRWVIGMSKYQCTRTGGPNFAYELCAHKTSDEIVKTLDLSRLEGAANGAEPLNIHTLELFYNKFASAGLRKGAMLPCYGLAESTVMSSAKPFMTPEKIIYVDPELLKNHRIKIVSAQQNGKQLISSGTLYMEIKIVNPESLVEANQYEVGEIWLHGKSISTGYYNNPEETEKTFNGVLKNDPNKKKYLRTGDLGFIHEGELFVCGRLKHLIIIHGQNFYPQDIEFATASSDSTIRIGCVVAYSEVINDNETLTVVAEIQKNTPKNQYPGIIENIQKAINTQFQISAHTIYLLLNRSIPKTTSGKLERNKCKELIKHHDIKPLYVFSQIEHITPEVLAAKNNTKDWFNQLDNAPANERVFLLTRLITSLTAEILGLQQPPQLDPQKGFFEFGLDSIKAIELKIALEEALNNRITLDNSLVFNYPNIDAVTNYLLIELGYKEPQQSAANTALMEEREDIAIIGMSGQFPGANNLSEFWDLLNEQKEGIIEVPPERWDVNQYYDPDPNKPGKINTKRAGFVSGIELFDPTFFAITPKAAEYLDPQQRMLLKQTWHALENAAIAPNSLKGSDTGVFIGISSHDYETLIVKTISDEAINRQIAIGNSASTAAGRLSYFLGLEGPNLSIDTACSSSLVAVHQACEHLIHNECKLAIVGGVNAILVPYLFINFSKAGMLSTEGRCKAFDADADGYVRGEGCGIVVLKRLSGAIRDNNQIIAVVKASGYNQDGACSGLTVPNGNAQKKLLSKVLEKSRLTAESIDYIECHGTGTRLGDPIEANAIAEVYGLKREKPLIIGSVKTNIGHLEAAAGIAGFIKTALAIQHELIPANLNFQHLNPQIHFNEMIEVASKPLAWQTEQKKPRYAGVSSFGFSGTNAHIILGQAPILSQNVEAILPKEHLFLLSAKSHKSLIALVASYLEFLSHTKECLADICYTLAIGRQHFNHRLAIVAKDSHELLAKLKAYDLGHAEIKPSLEPDNAHSLAEQAQAYQEGKYVDWHAYYTPYQKALKTVLLPNYPFQKDAYWLPNRF
jgi:acyl-CoA synthetase (AMP-forming)/AMP-acid ligase II/3-oxoacyl-(acyl-carrier-protein) synthase/acyl carrier protein